MKIVLWILVLLVFAGGGYAAWYFYFRETEGKVTQLAYPKEDVHLEKSVRLNVSDRGFALITAKTQTDLLFTQGFHHGKRAAKRLQMLRELFKGEATADFPNELSGLASLFFYLDLEYLAAQNRSLYSAQLQVLIQSYADGVTAGSKSGVPWTIEDILLLERGYAFLLGRNFSYEYSAHQVITKFGLNSFLAMSTYPRGDFGGLEQGLTLDPKLDVMFGTPFVETVRLIDSSNRLALQTRCKPFFSFLFEPMILALQGAFRAKGLSLVGQPFLWSADNGSLTYVQQPILANDEQFYRINKSAFLGLENSLFVNRTASKIKLYQEPPMHSRFGRNLTPLFQGDKASDYYYLWDGFRPSSDLAARYYLMEAGNVDEAVSAYQYHQVPATELTLAMPGGQVVNILTYPSDPASTNTRTARANSLFSGPYKRVGKAPARVQGVNFASDVIVDLEKAPVSSDVLSDLDQRLIRLLRAYMDGPLDTDLIQDPLHSEISGLFKSEAGPARDYFLQLVWESLLSAIRENLLEGKANWLPDTLDVEFKQFLLLSLDRRGGGTSFASGPVSAKAALIAQTLQDAYRDWNRAGGTMPPYGYAYTDASGSVSEKHFDFGSQSRDAARGVFFTSAGPTVSHVATYTVVFDKSFYFWVYPFVESASIGTAERAELPGKGGDEAVIKPVL